jgi:hypothetical protein
VKRFRHSLRVLAALAVLVAVGASPVMASSASAEIRAGIWFGGGGTPGGSVQMMSGDWCTGC